MNRVQNKHLNLALLDPHTLSFSNHEDAHPCDYLEGHYLKEVKGLKMSGFLTSQCREDEPQTSWEVPFQEAQPQEKLGPPDPSQRHYHSPFFGSWDPRST